MLYRLARRGIPPLIQKAKASADVNYNPIKRVPKCDDGFYRKANPLVDGTVLLRKFKSKTGREIDYVLATPEDRNLVATFSSEIYAKYNSCCAHYKVKPEELDGLNAPATDQMLENGKIYCAYDGDKLIGCSYNSFNYEDKFEEMFNGEMPGMKDPKFIVKEDYAEEFNNQPFTPGVNYYLTMLDIVQPQTGKFLPAGIKGFGVMEGAMIHSEYQKEGIFQPMFDFAETAFKEAGIYHLAGYCIATGTRKILSRGGFETIYILNYDDFKVNGKPVYSNLSDGATCCDVVVKVLK
uniref:N-acetyltransferase domain-containing protein n=1 Tax=Panagrellus redivivus TaxID=6233 RepID=A0A7E4V6M2_PANRE